MYATRKRFVVGVVLTFLISFVSGALAQTPDPTLLPVANVTQVPLTGTYNSLNVPGMAAGASYLDPLTHVKVYKLTSATFPTTGFSWTHDYAEGGEEVSLPQNTLGTRTIHVYAADGSQWLIDFTPGVGVSNPRNLSTSVFRPFMSLGVTFSNNPATPYYMFVSQGTIIRRIDLRSMTEAVGGGWPVSGETDAMWLHQNENDSFFTWMRGATGTTVVGYEPSSGTKKTYTNAGLNEPRIDRDASNRTVCISMTTPQNQGLFWDWRNNVITWSSPVMSYGGEPPVAHQASMRGYWVGVHYTLSFPWPFFKISATPNSVVSPLPGGPSEGGGHCDGNWNQHPANPDDQWFECYYYGSLVPPSNYGAVAPGGILLATASGQRRILAHLYNTSANYTFYSFAKLSSDGSYVLFTSDMNGSPRSDLFLAEMPTTGGAPPPPPPPPPPVDTTPPTVSITAPVASATVSGTIPVVANALDNVGVVGVAFFLDGVPFGSELTLPPYQVSWDTTLGTNFLHTWTAVARDAAGNTKTSTGVQVLVSNPIPDITPPSVTITAPAAAATLSGTTTISASASDNVGVVGVQFLIDGVAMGAEVMSAPYQISWNTTTVTNALHTVGAVARDAAGNRKTSVLVTVTVNNPVPDTTPPNVVITAPANGATVSGTLTISASASDNVGVVGVQFMLDGAPVGAEVTSAPYQVSWNTTTATNAPHSLTAVARDAAGNRTTATAVSVTVANPVPDTTPPTIAITAPANGATVSGTLTISASASDNVGVVGVQFLLDGAPLGAEVMSAPYQMSWTTTANGPHTITATARDAAGNRKTSASVSVTVANPVPDTTPPTVAITSPANGATVSGTLTISASASDNVGVVGVQFMLDGAPLGAEVTSAPYQVSWTTTTNGPHTITATARDAAGNRKTSASVSVTVANPVPDTTPPTVAITSPANGATVSGTLTISASASDNVGVVGVQFMLDGAPLGAEVTSAPYQVSWTTTTNGPHTITATARDAAGNRTTATAISVTVANPVPDTTPPTIAITAPANGATVSGTLTISASASDNVGVAGVQFILDSSPLGAEVTSAPYQVSWTTTTNGPHSITAIARDAAGNRTTATAISVTVANPVPDTTPPNVTITSPINGATVSGTLTISANASDNVGVVGVQFMLDSSPLGAELTSAPYQVSWTTTTNGPHSITAIARDAAGNRTTATAISVTVANPVPDTTPPNVAITSPANGATVSGTLTVSASASDNVGVVGVQFMLDGAPLGAEVTSAPYQVSWTTTTNGPHSITAIARDAAGNRTTATAISVTVANLVPDTTPPTVAITAPANGATVSGTLTVSASASDNVGVAGVQFMLDGAPLGAEVTSAPYQVSWTTTTNGLHTITAIARDAAGNRATSSVVSVTVANSAADTIPPTVSITRPTNGMTVSGLASIAATASDNVGVVAVAFFVDGGPAGADQLSAPYEVSWDTTRVTAGTHRLTATARDAAGNTGTSAAVTINILNNVPTTPDTTPPVVFITAPAGGANLSGIVQISASATDNIGVFGVQFMVDGMPVGAEVTSAPYQVSWNTASAINGSHTLTAVARDAAGNRTTSSPVAVSVANSPMQPSGPRSPFRSLIQVPGQFEAEDFDKGGEGVAYHDTTPGNQGGFYRTSEDVDIISPYPLGYVITNIEAGEWLTYSINVNQTGTYRLETLISSESGTGRFRAELDGIDKTGMISVPNTEWFGRFRWIAHDGVMLTAGQHVFRIYFERGSFNLDTIALTLQSASRDRVVRH